jgi:ribosomal protein S18 acetylase RimI-like enzyme
MSHKFVTKDGRTGRLRPATEDDAEALIQAVDGVARELVYFLRSRFELDVEKERIFIAEAAERGNLMLMAELDGRIVGWLTLFRARAEFLQHTAELGMGVLRGYRGTGIGTALMKHALEWASKRNFEKVNLGVRASNERARALYRKFGFAEEGYRVREIKDLDGHYDASVEMAIFVSAGPPAHA